MGAFKNTATNHEHLKTRGPPSKHRGVWAANETVASFCMRHERFMRLYSTRNPYIYIQNSEYASWKPFKATSHIAKRAKPNKILVVP